VRFRLIVDAWATFTPRACAPPRQDLDAAVSPSTIRLKRASTITEISTLLQAKYDVLRTIPIAFTISPGAEITKLGGAYQRTMHIEGPIFVPARR
jgi:hypothetical protein